MACLIPSGEGRLRSPRAGAGPRAEAVPLLALTESSREGERGYTLAFLLIMITVMNIAFAAAMPVWSTIARRDKEQELVFRGLQYAEAIRVFQRNHNRFPNTLDELVKVEPRSIRQLFPEPMSEHGEWGLLILAPGGAPAGGNAAGQQGAPGSPSGPASERMPRGVGVGGGRNQEQNQGQNRAGQNQGRGGQNAARNAVAVPPSGEKDSSGKSTRRTTGAIVGVYSASTDKAFRTFFGAETYDQWRFTYDLVPLPQLATTESAPPRVTSAWVGKPFRADLVLAQPQQGGRDLAGGSGAAGAPVKAPDFRPSPRREKP